MDARARTADAAVGLGLCALTVAQAADIDTRWRGAAVLATVAACLVLAVRRKWPVLALAVTTVLSVPAIPVHLQMPAGFALLVAAFTVGATTERTTTLVSAVTAAVVVTVGATLIAPESWTGANAPVTLVAATLVGAAVGDAVRSRRDLVAVLEERVLRAERLAEEEARRRVVEERLRIAREVHDLVGHHIAVANVQAGVAAYHLRERPDDAAAALVHVRHATKAVLDESRAMVGVLRDPADVDAPAPTEPAPGLGDLDRLLDSCAATGLHVGRTVAGIPRPLPATVDLVAYRLVQESLTNARKHGGDRAWMVLSYTPDGLDIEVGNPCSDDTRAAAGYGLVGMRERVDAVGGTLRAGPAGSGEFIVRAHLPCARETGADG